ncbi:MAG: hypothetical protein WC314_24010 [Vulcanimicrobiota bacterium]
MTQTPEFNIFCELLDEGESLENFTLTADQQLLVDLRQVLQEDTQTVALPSDFARQTAEMATSRLKELPVFDRWIDKSRVQLLDPLFKPSGLAKGLALVGLGGGIAALSMKALGVYGVLLLAFSALWLLREQNNGDFFLEFEQLAPHRARAANSLFYVIPALAVGAAAVLAASLLGVLARFSVSFREQDGGMLTGLQLLVAAGTVVLLVKALMPLWKACRARAANLGKLILFQSVHAAGFLGLAYLVSECIDSSATRFRSNYQPFQWELTFLPAMISIAVVWTLVIYVVYRNSPAVLNPPSLGTAGKAFLQSLLLSVGPIAIAMALFYQAHLTREIKDPSYEFILKDVQAWSAAQSAIPAELNGYAYLRPHEKDQVLRSLAEFHEKGPDSYRALDKTREALFQAQKVDFLIQLPRLEEALKLPYYSEVGVGGFRHQTLNSSFLTYRAVSYGLSLLAQEALANGDTDGFLDYVILGVRWAAKGEPGSSLQGVMKLTLLHIAVADLERPLAEGIFSQSQLNKLSSVLTEALPPSHELSDVMKREMVLTDTAFVELMSDGRVSWSELDMIGLPPIMSVLPLSYWESERKAYWNYELAGSSNWTALSNPYHEVEFNPMNVTSGSFSPNFRRMALEFCHLHSTMSALLIMTELERYRLGHGAYPSELASLPSEVQEKTRDFMDNKLLAAKGTFQYHKTQDGYSLESHSPWYDELQMESPRVYR